METALDHHNVAGTSVALAEVYIKSGLLHAKRGAASNPAA
jgi:hypothetical protein